MQKDTSEKLSVQVLQKRLRAMDAKLGGNKEVLQVYKSTNTTSRAVPFLLGLLRSAPASNFQAIMTSNTEYAQLLTELRAEEAKCDRQHVLVKAIHMIDSENLGFAKNRRILFEQSRSGLHYANAQKLASSQATHLGIDIEAVAPKFSYTEKQAIQRECFRIANQRVCQPIIDRMSAIQSEAAPFNVLAMERTKSEIVQLDVERRQGKLRLLQLEMQLFGLLEEAVTVRSDSLQTNEVEVLLREAELAEIKVRSLEAVMVDTFSHRDPRSLEAIKKVAVFVDEKLREIDNKLNVKLK